MATLRCRRVSPRAAERTRGRAPVAAVIGSGLWCLRQVREARSAPIRVPGRRRSSAPVRVAAAPGACFRGRGRGARATEVELADGDRSVLVAAGHAPDAMDLLRRRPRARRVRVDGPTDAPHHLLGRADSGVHGLEDCLSRRTCVGGTGSGRARSQVRRS